MAKLRKCHEFCDSGVQIKKLAPIMPKLDFMSRNCFTRFNFWLDLRNAGMVNQIPNSLFRVAGMVTRGCLHFSQRRFKDRLFLSALFVIVVSNGFPQSGQ